MESTPRREIIAASWAVEVLVRRDDHEMWLAGVQRFATEDAAHEWGVAQLARPAIVRYRLLPSALPPSSPELFPR